ncbi:MAG: LysM peptidoglycan-binding domain-containing M23 family metallopeptidase [Myxococcota bacterium]|jgi:lipoprotein NlpD|nr:LysM peptidoglycan-binding domain-containing M23 family metallopeptidase [Myxococcota bacterium]
MLRRNFDSHPKPIQSRPPLEVFAVLHRLKGTFLVSLTVLVLGMMPLGFAEAAKYRVRPGDSLWKIAKQHRVSMRALARVNRLPKAHRLQVGQRLNIPEGAALKGHRGTLSWPVRSQVTERFRHGAVPNDGVEFKLNANLEVRAAAAGQVVYSAPHAHYGHLVVLAHGQGLRTIYGHSALAGVTLGRRVQNGAILAKGVKTRASGLQALHFEVRRGTQAVNPLAWLQKLQ